MVRATAPSQGAGPRARPRKKSDARDDETLREVNADNESLVPPARDAPRPLDLERLGAQRLAPLHQHLAHGPNLGALALAQGEGEVGGGSPEP